MNKEFSKGYNTISSIFFNKFLIISSYFLILSLAINIIYLKFHNKICTINEIKELKKGSTIIVGHAYGSIEKSKKEGDNNISKKIINFYNSNEDNIDLLIFSGDVLNKSTKNNWKNFYSNFKADKLIYIAPGNHDVGDESEFKKKRIFYNFNHRNQKNTKFPFGVIKEDTLFIIDDSNKNKSPQKALNLISKTKSQYKSIYIIRHHILPRSFSKYANSKVGYTIKDKNLVEFSRKNLSFIYGDGGLRNNYKRYKCKKIGETKHILNGIGEKKDDTILVINKNKLFRINIK